MKKIGIITDKSFLQEGYKEINGRYYYYRGCPSCGEIFECGYSKDLYSSYAIASRHECENWIDEARSRIGHIDRLIKENGFYFESKSK